MDYRRVGGSGLKVSSVSLGSWLTLGSRAIEADVARDTLRAAVDGGVTYLDTADVYAGGKAEAFLGEQLEDLPRERLVIASKVYFPTREDDPNGRGLGRKHVVQSCDASLQRLGLEYLDLYLCHRHDPEVPAVELVRTMDDLIRRGKILYWGVSCWSAEQMREACEVADRLLAPRPIAVQSPYNMLRPGLDQDVLPACRELGIGLLAFSPLEQGLLTGKYSRDRVPAGTRLADDKRNRWMKERLTEANFARVDALQAIAAEAGLPLATLALAWCLRDPQVASTVTGASRPEQVRANLGAAGLTLEPTLLERIEQALGAAGAA